MKIGSMGLLAALALLQGVSNASAAIVTVTFTGTVADVLDPNGAFSSIFGSDNLVGDSYVATYVFNTNLGYTYSSTTESYAYGGSVYGSASPLLSNSVTINGVSYSITQHNFDEIENCNNTCIAINFTMASVYQQYDLAEYTVVGPALQPEAYIQSLVSTSTGTLPISITTPFTYTVGPSDDAYSQLVFATYDSSTGGFQIIGEVVQNADIEARISTISLTTTPLPPTWIMMLTGLAGFGLVACRRKRKAAAASAA